MHCCPCDLPVDLQRKSRNTKKKSRKLNKRTLHARSFVTPATKSLQLLVDAPVVRLMRVGQRQKTHGKFFNINDRTSVTTSFHARHRVTAVPRGRSGGYPPSKGIVGQRGRKVGMKKFFLILKY